MQTSDRETPRRNDLKIILRCGADNHLCTLSCRDKAGCAAILHQLMLVLRTGILYLPHWCENPLSGLVGCKHARLSEVGSSRFTLTRSARKPIRSTRSGGAPGITFT